MNQATGTTLNLPVLDLRRFERGSAERESFLSDLRAAARDVGFFYLTGHGIAQQRIDGVFGLARRFFERSEEHTSELQSLMRISYAVFCLKKKKKNKNTNTKNQ